MNVIFRQAAPTALIIIVILVVAALAFLSNRQEQLYLSIVWAGPLLVLATAIALLPVAMA